MNNLNERQITLLKSKYITKSKFEVGEFVFDGWEGEWLVTKNNAHIDVFTFNKMAKKEFEKTLDNIFNN